MKNTPFTVNLNLINRKRGLILNVKCYFILIVNSSHTPNPAGERLTAGELKAIVEDLSPSVRRAVLTRRPVVVSSELIFTGKFVFIFVH